MTSRTLKVLLSDEMRSRKASSVRPNSSALGPSSSRVSTNPISRLLSSGKVSLNEPMLKLTGMTSWYKNVWSESKSLQ